MARIPTLRPAPRVVSTATARPQPKAVDSHYRRKEHRDWSAAVISRAGHACQDCGRTGTRLFADHVHELRDGGAAFDLANGRARCGSCHAKKTAAVRAERQRR